MPRRNRGRRSPPPVVTAPARHTELETLENAVDELLLLVPRLFDALARDQAAARERVTAGGPAAPSLPINADVLAAVVELSGIDFRRMTSWYIQLDAAGEHGEARRLAGRVMRWHRLVRRAIGLSRPAQRLIRDGAEVACPLHDNPLATLLQPGDEGTLHDPGAPERVTWRRDERIICPHCRAEWRPGEYGLLARLTRDAMRRRAA